MSAVLAEPRFLTTHCRHDPAIAGAPGLVRMLARGQRQKEKLDVTYTRGRDTFRFVGFEPLGGDDVCLLQALTALAGPHGAVLSATPTTAAGVVLRDGLACVGVAANADSLLVTTSRSELLREAGLSKGGKEVRRVERSLLRLASVTLHIRCADGRREAATRLLSWSAADDVLKVALNPRVAAVVLGTTGQYVRISMDEVRALKREGARLIHQRLCSWLDQGATRVVRLDTLVEYLYPGTPATGSTGRMRRRAARLALQELGRIGWGIAPAGGDAVAITRPAPSVG